MDSRRFRVFPPLGPIPAAPGGLTWNSWMDIALLEAQKAASNDEVPVGAVLLTADGVILSQCSNKVMASHDPTAHAEILALRKGAKKLGNERLCGCIMLVTLEPCLMCAAAIKEARLAGIVFGAADVKEGAIISRADYIALTGLSRHIWHLGGILSSKCAALLQNFFTAKR